MLECASAGETSIPAPVQVFVYDTDVDDVREYVRRRRFGITNPLWIVIGSFFVVWGLLRAQLPHTPLDLWMLYFGVWDIAGGWLSSKKWIEVLRPSDLQFSDAGLEVAIGIEPRWTRRYPWPQIRTVDDIGEAFVLILKSGSRFTFPKRSFADDGREAWAFFAAHGVAGRTPPLPSPAVS